MVSRRFAVVVFAAMSAVAAGAGAQTRYMYMKGESLHPAYEGWWPNPDGSFTMFFGYMNPNWEE